MAVTITLKTSGGSNVIAKDPSLYMRSPSKVGTLLTKLDASRIHHLRGIHYDIVMRWNHLTQAQADDLRELFYADELLYLDDTDVPYLTESTTIRTSETDDFVGITNPSGTHKAYWDLSTGMPTTKDALEGTEFTTAEYQAIDADDANTKDVDETDLTSLVCNYMFQKFCFKTAISAANTRRLRVKVKVSSEDASDAALDGADLYLWDGSGYRKVASVTNANTTELEYRELQDSVASLYVDADTYIRVLLKSRKSQNIKKVWATAVSNLGASKYVTSAPMVVFDSKLYVTLSISDGYLYEWDGEGSSWILQVSLGTRIYSMCVFNSKLYVGDVQGKLHEWNGSTSFIEKADISDSLTCLGVYDSTLYAGDRVGGLWEWNGVDTLSDKSTGGDANADIIFICERSGKLICGDDNGEIYEWDDVDTLTSKGDVNENIRTSAWILHDGEVYAGSYTTGRLYKWDGTSSFTEECAQFGSEKIHSLTSDGTYIYAVTASAMKILRWTDGETEWSELVEGTGSVDATGMSRIVYFSGALYGLASFPEDERGNLFEAVSGPSLNLKTYFAEYEVNEDLDNTITLTHTPILAAGDVIEVRNVTQSTTLTLTTHYTISGRVITFSAGVTDGDVVEVDYNRYLECVTVGEPEVFNSGDPSSERNRSVEVHLATLTRSF